MQGKRDHGGNLDAAIAKFGGARADWLDLSTGINPCSYPIPKLSQTAWTTLPDAAARDELIKAARQFWSIPDTAGILPVPGASAAIVHIPLLARPARVSIPGPTYNEHAASFVAAGWEVIAGSGKADATVHVHPNNPDGRLWQADDLTGTLRVIDESFCDVLSDATLIDEAARPGTVILKSFGKFWGLAGVRLGFAIGDPALLDQLDAMLGPWAVAGPAIEIGTAALQDHDWASQTRLRLVADAARVDGLMTARDATLVGGTTLYRLYEVDDAAAWQRHLAAHHIWSRIFPYNARWLRLGLPPASGWQQLENALT
ncbi:pyridoxal phosphate-dependent class II aminotransferase [Sulfitobacter sp. F26204]|uniref:threonine-phosphate decarboxylase n=1 Tax=Sulfitobacter sp. F26204 TaxID=2996014 RepID=UPI00225DE05A|nr:threonine-phosphate decarboxylase [Sulfitobacter sp. F26204]MCX7558630.1 pyridoxal phosphate-dependent class II aminotransferase [Sulfitobacter sp. F26204]